MIFFTRIALGAGLLLASAVSAAKGSPETASRIEELKRNIQSISKANINRTDNYLEVRNELQPLVNELLALTPDRLEAEKLDDVAGAWRNLWSDQEFGPGVDASQVYQVVSKDGYYYNISRNVSPKGEFTNFLRGIYEDQGSYLKIEFTDNSVSPNFYEAGTPLVQLAKNFEAKMIPSQSIGGPIGVKGVLINSYVDDQLRIVTGNSSSSTDLSLFVLERVTAVEASQ